MKKITFVLGLCSLVLFSLNLTPVVSATTIRVGATPVPHSEILEVVQPLLAEQGITLQIIEFNDYVRPNLAVHDGELDANFFQHKPYLEAFNADANTDLVAIADIHIEPLGVYSTSLQNLSELANRAQVAIPNDATNGGRALLLLQDAGLIELDPATGIMPTPFDLTTNERSLRFFELEAAQLTRSLADVDIAVINGNYALLADLVPTEDALFLEGAESPYVNILAVQASEADNPALLELAKVLQSDQVREFILQKYEGSVVPVF